jgi:hypothetical protein
VSHGRRLDAILSAERLDLTLAKIGIVASLLALSLRLVASQVFLVVIPAATGVACTLYVVVRGGYLTGQGLPTLSASVAGHLPAVTFFGLAGVVGLTHVSGGRTVPVYLLTGAVGTAILLQVLLADRNHFAHGVVLAELLVASVVTRLSALYATPGFVGVDVWTHVPVWVDGIARTGSLAPLAESKYVMAPVFHVLGAAGSFVFGSPRSGVYLTVGLLVPLSAVFLYLSAAEFVTRRWALFAATLFVFGDQFVRWGLHVIPTSLGLALFLATLYGLTRMFSTDAATWTVGVTLLFALAVVFTHQVSTAVVVTLLGVAASVAVLRDIVARQATLTTLSRTAISVVAVFVTTTLTTLVSWSVTPFAGGERFIWRRLRVFWTVLLSEAGFLELASEEAETATAAEPTSLVSTLIPYVELFGFTLLLAGAVLGGLVIFHRRERIGVTFTYLASGALMFVIVFGMSFFGVRTLLPGRWIGFMYAPLSVLCAVGLAYLARTAPNRVVVVVFVVLAVGYPVTMVTAEKATLDSPAFDDAHSRFAYTESEIAAVETIQSIYPATLTDRIATDHPYQTLFRQIAPYEGGTIVMGADGPTEDGPVVYRTYQTAGRPLFDRAAENPFPVERDTLAPDEVCEPTRNRVYATDDATLCPPSSVTSAGGVGA